MPSNKLKYTHTSVGHIMQILKVSTQTQTHPVVTINIYSLTKAHHLDGINSGTTSNFSKAVIVHK